MLNLYLQYTGSRKVRQYMYVDLVTFFDELWSDGYAVYEVKDFPKCPSL